MLHVKPMQLTFISNCFGFSKKAETLSKGPRLNINKTVLLLCYADSNTVKVILSEWLNAATLRVVGDTILSDSVVIYE